MEKWAIIKKSDKSKENLPTKSLTQEIIKMKKQGYYILDER